MLPKQPWEEKTMAWNRQCDKARIYMAAAAALAVICSAIESPGDLETAKKSASNTKKAIEDMERPPQFCIPGRAQRNQGGVRIAVRTY